MQLLSESKNDVSALQPRRHFGVGCCTVWLSKHKLMKAMRLHEQNRELSGAVV